MIIKKILKQERNVIIISIVLGLGLAALFRRACTDKKCIVIEGPSLEDTSRYYYKINNDCYKYEAVVSECN